MATNVRAVTTSSGSVRPIMDRIVNPDWSGRGPVHVSARGLGIVLGIVGIVLTAGSLFFAALIATSALAPLPVASAALLTVNCALLCAGGFAMFRGRAVGRTLVTYALIGEAIGDVLYVLRLLGGAGLASGIANLMSSLAVIAVIYYVTVTSRSREAGN